MTTEIKTQKELLAKIQSTLDLWCHTFRLIGYPHETPRFTQLIKKEERFVLKSTQGDLFYYIHDLTADENDFLDNMEFKDRWNQYKEIRTEFLVEHYPTIVVH